MFKIVSMYTADTPYEDEIKKLQESLVRFKLSHTIYRCKSRGSWAKNCQMKANVIAEALNSSDGDIVWTDADSVILRAPSLFNELSCDIALHALRQRWGMEYLSGTVYFANNAKVKQVVNNWIRLNQENDEWDQKNLQRVMSGVDLSFLPPEYCKIFDRHSQRVSNPVIVHNQASRRFKGLI